MNKNIELLAPGGDIDCIKAAILAGADAVYCGLNKFNARNRAANISFEDLNGILRLAHQHHCQVFLTLNIVIVESEIPAVIGVLNKLVNTSIDGIIVQDFGMFYLLSHYFKSLKIHASTQLTTHNAGQIKFLSKLAATRVNLSRELDVHEIKALSLVAHNNNLLVEVFVHGSNCLCFSGICYISSVRGGNSGNRGRCSQPCRDQYVTTAMGKNYPLNLKDNSAYSNLRDLADAGVDSLKIEGRIKKFHYVYTVVDAWRKQLQGFYEENKVSKDTSALYKVFNRDFSNGFLTGAIHKDMFIDNPRDHSAIHLSGMDGSFSEGGLEKAKGDVYEERTDIIATVESKIQDLSIAKAPLSISISGECGTPLSISVTSPDETFVLVSESNLTNVGTQPLDRSMLLQRLKVVNDTAFYLENLELDHLPGGLFISFKELTGIKKELMFRLNDSRERIEPVAVPILEKHRISDKPSLSVLISSPSDLTLSQETSATIYYQLPNSFNNGGIEIVDLFTNHPNIIPWFPSVLIGDDYRIAVEILGQLQPRQIVTNNTGIAYEASLRGINWIAGPYLNIVNSFSLQCLKEEFNCSGAFVSNELSKIQIKGIKKPANFDLYYRIYHPILLMTSRQCLFHQVSGCRKEIMDDGCIEKCEKNATITNLKKETFFIEKSRGNFHTIYNDFNFLNTDIVGEVKDVFSGFFIDLRDITTQTKIERDKAGVITLFEKFVAGETNSEQELRNVVRSTTCISYSRGI